MAMQGEERRKHIRIFLPGGQVRLHSGMLLALVGKVLNISTGGIKFTCTTHLPVNEEFDMELTLPSGMKFKCASKIIHTESVGTREGETIYGAQFLSLGENEKTQLGELIMKRLSEQKADDDPAATEAEPGAEQ